MIRKGTEQWHPPAAGKLVGRRVGELDIEAPIITDRLGSGVSRNADRRGYYPYGEEKPVTAEQNQFKFATYYRDALTKRGGRGNHDEALLVFGALPHGRASVLEEWS